MPTPDDTFDWQDLSAWRRKRAGEPDAESLRQIEELWRERLSPDSEFSEEQLDAELVKLLETIHHAF